MSITVTIRDENALKGALDAIRTNEDPTNWVLVGHDADSPNVVALQATGTGGFNELRSHLKDDQVQYALLRIFVKVDLTTTTKFVYLYNLGERVPLMKKGRFGVVKGDVQKRFQPYHADIEIENPEGATEEEITKKVSEGSSGPELSASGSFSNLPGKLPKFGQQNVAAQPGQQPLPSLPAKKAVGGGIGGAGSKGPTFSPELVEAIKAVHSDKSPADWVLATYEDNATSRPIILLGSGEGGADALKTQLSSDRIFYGLVRVIDMIDSHPTVKFALIVFVGNDVSIMKKAQTTTHKGAVETQFQPFHVTMNVSDVSEVSSDIVLSTVQFASGSKSHVK
ncbi:actin depolymerizing protein [Gonapodya prolifera JEL478]|uniref:Actin depolymerizing protein n=1 Tax=Gonapodya prolifera (strain JEL478) TaxID=1344416 RepID=A0A139B0E2_GONPJ|nr:actin depolymerizing protein [Gonapodya prolifera JEL478]|eukprot:KXS22439.1 actin depolymerizing protein [Gonapodya prolifera JEL478]